MSGAPALASIHTVSFTPNHKLTTLLGVRAMISAGARDVYAVLQEHVFRADDNDPDRLTPRTKEILQQLTPLLRMRKVVTWPCRAVIERECGISTKTMYRHLQTLQNLGWIVRHEIGNDVVYELGEIRQNKKGDEYEALYYVGWLLALNEHVAQDPRSWKRTPFEEDQAQHIRTVHCETFLQDYLPRYGKTKLTHCPTPALLREFTDLVVEYDFPLAGKTPVYPNRLDLLASEYRNALPAVTELGCLRFDLTGQKYQVKKGNSPGKNDRSSSVICDRCSNPLHLNNINKKVNYTNIAGSSESHSPFGLSEGGKMENEISGVESLLGKSSSIDLSPQSPPSLPSANISLVEQTMDQMAEERGKRGETREKIHPSFRARREYVKQQQQKKGGFQGRSRQPEGWERPVTYTAPVSISRPSPKAESVDFTKPEPTADSVREEVLSKLQKSWTAISRRVNPMRIALVWSPKESQSMYDAYRRLAQEENPMERITDLMEYAMFCWPQVRSQFSEKFHRSEMNPSLFRAFLDHFCKTVGRFVRVRSFMDSILTKLAETPEHNFTDEEKAMLSSAQEALREMGVENQKYQAVFNQTGL